MSARTIRTLALTAGAAALVVSAAAPAMAVDLGTKSTFPAKIAAKPGDVFKLSYTGTVQGVDICAGTTWTVKVVGQRSGIATPLPTASCTANVVTTGTFTVGTPTTKSGKANAVVKLVGAPTDPNSTAEDMVLTTVVKVNHKANPGKGNKPA